MAFVGRRVSYPPSSIHDRTHRRHRSGLRRPARRPGLRPQVPRRRRLRHPRREGGRAAPRLRPRPASSPPRCSGHDAAHDQRSRRPEGSHLLRGGGADARRRTTTCPTSLPSSARASPWARRSSRGAVVVYESTVYPGVTEDICGPILERESGLKRGVDFKLGYSPERINPGDTDHVLEDHEGGQRRGRRRRSSASPPPTARIVDAGVHRAPSIKVAEAAKVIENTQRDLNIALMNELAIIFDRMGIRTADVLAAAGTKWNFLKFKPGLVGGHCIGVDPYYLTHEGRAARLPARGHPRRPAHQQQHGPVHRPEAREAAHRRRRHRQGRARRHPRHHLQGRLHRPAQQQGPRHPPRAARSSASTRGARSARRARPRRCTSTASSSPRSRRWTSSTRWCSP